MTKRRYAIGLAIMATVLSVCATGASSPAGKTTDQSSVEGRWVGRITGTPHGDMTMGLALKQEGNKVTGTLTTEHTGEMPVEGELNERALKLATGTHAEMQIVLTGTLKDDGSLSGYLSSEVGDMTWSAERVKDKQ